MTYYAKTISDLKLKQKKQYEICLKENYTYDNSKTCRECLWEKECRNKN